MARDLELGIGGKSADAVRALEATAAGVDKLKRKADDLGDEFRQASRDAAQLERELTKLAVESRLLAKEFSASDVAGRDTIKKKIDLNRTAATELKKIRADILGDTERDSKHATALWGKAATDLKKIASKSSADLSGLAELFPGLAASAAKNPYALTAGVAAATVVGPPAAALAGATVGGATIAGAGLGAVGLGIAGAAAGSDEVGKAWSETIAHLKAQWIDASKPFIGPTVEAAHTVNAALSDIHLDTTLEKASHFVAPLTEGAVGFAKGVISGVESLVDSAGPEIEVLRTELPALGKDIEQSFKLIAGGAEGGAEGLRDTINFIGILTVAVGTLVRATEDIWHVLSNARETTGSWIHEFHEGLSDINPVLGYTVSLADTVANAFNSEQTVHSLQKIKPAADDATYSFNGLAVAEYNTADAARDLDNAFSTMLGQTLNLDEANIRAEQGFNKLGKTIRDNHGALEGNSEAALNNRAAIDQQIETLNQVRVAQIAAGNGTLEATQKANGAFLAQLERIRAVAVANGINTASIDAMIAKYRELARIPAIDKSITLTTRYKTVGDKSGSAFVEVLGHGFDRADARASGGPVKGGTPYLVGEHGPEYFVPGVSGTIVDAATTKGLQGMPTADRTSAAAGWGAAAPAMQGPSTLGIVFGGNTDSAYATAFASLIRNNAIMLNVDGVPVKVS